MNKISQILSTVFSNLEFDVKKYMLIKCVTLFVQTCFLFFQLNKLVETLTKQLETKGIEINKYREEYNLQIKGEDSRNQEKQEKDVKTGGVLVSKET